MKVLIVSNLTIDHNSTESGSFVGPGGPAYFCGKTLENLNIETYIVSPYGNDFPLDMLSKSHIIPAQAIQEKTLVFINNILPGGKRSQSISNYYNSLEQFFDGVKWKSIPKVDVVIVAPILPYIGGKTFKHLKNNFPAAHFILLPQGFYRKIEADQTLSHINWVDPEDIIEYFDIVIYSENDDMFAVKKAIKWSRGGKMVVITRGKNGCSVYRTGLRDDFHAFSVDTIRDSTGAGDIFASSFVYEYFQSLNYKEAARFANASAALSLRFSSDKLQYGEVDIIGVLEKASVL